MEDNKDEMELRIKEMETAINLDNFNKDDENRIEGGSGDVNKDGFVTEGDSKQILDFLVGKGTLEDSNLTNAKVTQGNDEVGLIDIITIQREINNLSNKVNNIVPVTLEDKSFEVGELTGDKLDFKEIVTQKLKVRNRDISTDIEDLSRNLQVLKNLSGRDASFNSLMTKSLDIIGDKFKVGGIDVMTMLRGKQDKLNSKSVLGLGTLFVTKELRVKEVNVLDKVLSAEEKVKIIDQSMNLLMDGGVLDLGGIREEYEAADAKILQDVSAAIQASAKQYAESLDQRSKIELQELVSNSVKGNVLDFTTGNFEELDMKTLKVNGIDIFEKIDYLDKAIDTKVFEVADMDPDTDLSLNFLTVAKLYVRKDGLPRGEPEDVIGRMNRQIKELDATVDVLKQSVSVVMGLLADFLREQ